MFSFSLPISLLLFTLGDYLCEAKINYQFYQWPFDTSFIYFIWFLLLLFSLCVCVSSVLLKSKADFLSLSKIRFWLLIVVCHWFSFGEWHKKHCRSSCEQSKNKQGNRCHRYVDTSPNLNIRLPNTHTCIVAQKKNGKSNRRSDEKKSHKIYFLQLFANQRKISSVSFHAYLFDAHSLHQPESERRVATGKTFPSHSCAWILTYSSLSFCVRVHTANILPFDFELILVLIVFRIKQNTHELKQRQRQKRSNCYA